MKDKDTYWQKYIDIYLSAGLTQKKFCEHHSLRTDQFKYHYRRLHLKSINNKSTPKEKQSKLPLAPVSIISDIHTKKPSSPPSGICTIHLPNGVYINLHDAKLVECYLSRSVGLC